MVRAIFRLYRELKNVLLVQAEAQRLGLKTKRYKAKTGRVIGGRSFSRGHIYQLLSNPLYIGEIDHKGARHPGQHPAIIDQETWDAVQSTLAANTRGERDGANAKGQSLLASLLYDEQGNRFTPTHATKGGRRYRYYALRPSVRRSGENSQRPAVRIAAPEIEAAVTRQLVSFMRDSGRLIKELRLHDVPPMLVKTAVAEAARLSAQVEDETGPDRRTILLEVVDRIELGAERLSLSISQNRLIDRILGEDFPVADEFEDQSFQIGAPLKIIRRGSETRLILPGHEELNEEPDQSLIKAIARGTTWFYQLADGKSGSIAEIAESESVTEAYVRRLLEFALLSPTQVEGALGAL